MMPPFEQAIASQQFVVLDTETTGLKKPAEIVQIAIIDPQGAALIDTLVKPVQPIPWDATAIHGITNAMVRQSPTWAAVQPQVAEIIRGRTVIVYNAKYDRMLMHWSDEAAGIGPVDYRALAGWECAMEWYAALRGFPPRWQKLTVAIREQGLSINAAHNALGDCQMTLALINHVLRKR